MIIGEPGDIHIFKTMSNIKNAMEYKYGFKDLGILIRIIYGYEWRLFRSN